MRLSVRGVCQDPPTPAADSAGRLEDVASWGPNQGSKLHVWMLVASLLTLSLASLANIAALHRCSPLSGCAGAFLQDARPDLCNSAGTVGPHDTQCTAELACWNKSMSSCNCETGWAGRLCEACAKGYALSKEGGCVLRSDPVAKSDSDALDSLSRASGWVVALILLLVLVAVLIAICMCC